MNETEYQELFRLWQHSEEASAEREKAVNTLHSLIYRYPVRRFRADNDTASEFYLYMYGRIEEFFSKYDPSYGITFLTYVSHRLKGYYFNFIERCRPSENPLEYTLDENWDTPAENSMTGTDSVNSQINRYIKKAFHVLEDDEHLVTRLYYGFPLLLKQLRNLVRKQASFRVFTLYREYLDRLQQWEDRQRRKTESIQEKLARLESEIIDSNTGHDRREALLDEIRKYRPPVPITFIGRLIKESKSNVYRKIESAREKIKKFLSQLKPYFKGTHEATR